MDGARSESVGFSEAGSSKLIEDEIVLDVSDVSEGSEAADEDDMQTGRDEITDSRSANAALIGPVLPSPPPPPAQRSQVPDSWKPSDEKMEEEGRGERDGHRAPEDSNIATPSTRGRPHQGSSMVVPEADQFLEMDLRRRALEAELRRTNSEHNRQSHTCMEASSGLVSRHDDQAGTEEGDGENEDIILVHPPPEEAEEEEEEREGVQEPVLKVGELLEERLRERALQAMLAKRQKSS